MKNKLKTGVPGDSSDALFDRIYKLLAVCAVTVSVIPVGAAFINSSPLPAAAGWLLPVAAVAAGYMLQHTVAALMRYKRTGGVSRSYERSGQYVNLIVMMPAIIISLIAAVFIYTGASDLLLHFSQNDHSMLYYGSSPLIPVYVTTTIFAFLISGAYMWFIPFDRLISYRSVWGLLTLQMLLFVFFGITNPSAASGQALCFAIFVICVMLIVNQSYILRTYDTGSDSVITPTARMYNMALVLVILLCIFAIGAVVGIVLIGISVLARLLLYTMIGQFVSSEDDSDAVIENFESAVFGGVSATSTGLNKFILAAFIVLVTVFALILIFGRGRGLLRRLIAFLTALYNRLTELLLSNMRSLKSAGPDEYNPYKKRILVSEQYYVGSSSVNRRNLTYHDFTKALSACRNEAERVRLAYATLVRHWREMDYGIRISDTPNEICEKLIAKTEIDEAAEITELFEKLQYGRENSGPVEPGLLEKMCALIKKYRS